MQLKDVAPTSQAEDWVLAAFKKAATVGGGAFSLVLEADHDGYVVKLTRSEADYQALVLFGSTNPHFPIVIRHATNQGRGNDCSYHAIMLERLVTSPVEAISICSHIDRQEEGKRSPSGLLSVADNMENGIVGGYPASLAQAFRALGTYARNKMLLVDLNNRTNWGRRADGTLVVFDLVHTRLEW